MLASPNIVGKIIVLRMFNCPVHLFVCTFSQVLFLRYLMNGLNNSDKTDLIRYSKVKVTPWFKSVVAKMLGC